MTACIRGLGAFYSDWVRCPPRMVKPYADVSIGGAIKVGKAEMAGYISCSSRAWHGDVHDLGP